MTHRVIHIQPVDADVFTHLGPEVSGGEEAGQRVPNKHQFVRRYNEALSSGHEDAGRLVPLHAAEEQVDGVRQAGEVGEALGRVEGQQLRVLQGEGHRQRRGRGQLHEGQIEKGQSLHSVK